MGDLFRADALRRLRDPQQLDSAIRLTSPAGWLAIASLALIIAAIVAWGFLGSITFRVDGLGVVLEGKSAIYNLPAPASATVQSVLVRTGQHVHRGDRLLVLKQAGLDAQKAAAQRQLDSLTKLRANRAESIKSDIAERRRDSDASIAAQQAQIADLKKREKYLSSLYASQRNELKKGYITRREVESTANQLAYVREQIREADVSIPRLRTDQTEFETRLNQELEDLDHQIVVARGRLDELSTTEKSQSVITSPVDGTVTEVDADPGGAVDAGANLMVIEQAGAGLQLYAYFPVAKGKKVAEKMRAQVSPTSVERDIYGSIVGEVLSVSALPVGASDLVAKLGNAQLVRQLTAAGPAIQVVVVLKTDPKTPSGLAWSSSAGPPVRITSGTTALTTVTVRRVRPVDLIVPIYETWLGTEGS